MRKNAELWEKLRLLEIGRTELVSGNGGTIRTVLHKLYGPGGYVVRTAQDGFHAVTLICGASNALRSDLGLPAEAVRSRTGAEIMAGVMARNKAKSGM